MNLTWNSLPGPATSWWGLPALFAMRRDYLAVIERQREHGDLVRQQILNERAVDVFAPELVRQLMLEHADAMQRWERATEVFSELMGQSVLVSEGPTWQRQRRMLMPAFTPKRMVGYGALMVDATRAGLVALPAGETAMDVLFCHLTMDVILRTLFSTPAGPHTRAATAALQTLSEAALREMFWPMTLPDWLPLPGKAAKRRSLRRMRALIQDHIDSRRTDPAPRSDLLAMLQALRDEETGAALSPREVFDQCMVSFAAGVDTSATALTWWSGLMAQHAPAQARAVAELRAVLAGREPSADDIGRLPWLGATLKEAMRLFPPIAAMMTRRLTREVLLNGVHLPARTLLRVTPWVLHRDPRWWPHQPNGFWPERFLQGAVEPIPRGAYLPFGVGPRVCLGQHFAVQEMTLIAAMLLQRFELLPLGPLPRPQLAVTLRPEHGLHLNLKDRAGP